MDRARALDTMLLRHQGFRRLVLARDLIREDREPAPTIGELAREVGISPFHFIRQFEAVFGLTPRQYRIQERLERAKRSLAAGQPVTDVCMAVGFSSLGSFSSLFTRRFGETPSSYRRRLRAIASAPADVAKELEPGCLTLMASLPSSSSS